MSRNFDLHCKTCDVDAEIEINWGEQELCGVLQMREHFEALAPLFKADSTFTVMNGDVPDRITRAARFLVKHRLHNVVVRDEYGVDVDQCGKRVPCAGCGADLFCQLERNHADACVPWRAR